MQRPSMKELLLKNPSFFRADEETPEFLVADVDRRIEREGELWVLKIHTSSGTRPVYRVNPDLTLDYIRHGW